MRSSESADRRVGILRRSAKETKQYKVLMRVLTAALGVIIAILSILYIIAVLYKRTGSFTVSFDKYQMLNYGLAISESRDMRNPQTNLNAAISENITNIAEAWLPDTLGNIDGEDNGDNYICYTFYTANLGDFKYDYKYTVNVSNVSRDLDEAIRIRLYVDGVPTTYAKMGKDGNPEEGTVPFYSNAIAAEGVIEDFKPGDITKYTVVIWIEGPDPDCVNWLIDGQLKVDMTLNVVKD